MKLLKQDSLIDMQMNRIPKTKQKQNKNSLKELVILMIFKFDMQIRCQPIGAHVRPSGRFALRQSGEEQDATAGALQRPIRTQQRQSRDVQRPLTELRQQPARGLDRFGHLFSRRRGRARRQQQQPALRLLLLIVGRPAPHAAHAQSGATERPAENAQHRRNARPQP